MNVPVGFRKKRNTNITEKGAGMKKVGTIQGTNTERMLKQKCILLK